jgi:4-amino-4-deoxy-L-arabinose transferase-like glycosyltransferase
MEMKRTASITALHANYILAALLLLGAFLRIYGINSESLWFDEAFSVHLSKMNIADLIKNTAEDVHPPLYYIILNFWETIFGDSEISSRALSLIFNILTIYFLYRAASYLYDKKTGLVAAFILAISPFHIYYSQEARMYSLLGLLSLLSVYYFMKSAAEIKNINFHKYVIFSALMLYTHVYGFWILSFEILFVLGLYYFKRIEKQKIKFFVLALAATLILYLPWAGVLFSQAYRINSGFWIPPCDWLALPETFVSFSGSLILSAIYAFLLLTAFFYIKKTRLTDEAGITRTVHVLYLSKIRDELFLWMWFILPVIIPLLISFLYQPIYDAKYAIAASLGFYVLIARAIVKIKLRGFRPVILSIILLLSLIPIFENANMQTKERWRDAIDYVNKHAEKDDWVVVNSLDGEEVGIFDYYLKPELDRRKIFVNNCSQREPGKKNILRKTTQIDGKLWLIKTARDCGSAYLLNTLSEGYEISEKESFPAIYKRYMFQESYGEGKKDVFLEKTTISSNIEVLVFARKGTIPNYAEK